MCRMNELLLLGWLCLLFSAPASAQINVGSDGSDLFFDAGDPMWDPDGDDVIEIDLATQGTYLSDKWCVVFNYTGVLVPAGKTVTFKNHPSRAPVVWLSQDDIVIDGTVNLDGQIGSNSSTTVYYAEPGPGGFRGGIGRPVGGAEWNTSSGFGMCGGFQQGYGNGSGGGYATFGFRQNPAVPFGSLYNNAAIFQLVGGSGGAAYRGDGVGSWARGGGAGGGAILMAANDEIIVNASAALFARGGVVVNGYQHYGGSGAGGAIRLVADRIHIASGAALAATGGSGVYFGGNGRIRIEGNLIDRQNATSPTASEGVPGSVFPPPGSPTVRVAQVGSTPVSDPTAEFGLGGTTPDVTLPISGLTDVVIITENVDLGAEVYLRLTRAQGAASEVQVTDGVTNPLVLTGNPEQEASTTIELDLGGGYTALQAHVVLPTP